MVIELEFNPFSAASRAARAERAGRISDALRLYAKTGQHRRIRECLEDTISYLPIRTLLIDAADQLLDLNRTLKANRRKDAPAVDVMRSKLAEEVRSAAEVLWQTAGRLASVLAHKTESPNLLKGLERETDRLTALLSAIRSARAGLSELMITGQSDAGVEPATMGLKALGEAAHDLRDTFDEKTN